MGRRKNRSKTLAVAAGCLMAAVGLLCVGSALLLHDSGAPRDLKQALFGASSWDEWKGTAVFLGDSITDFCDLETYYPGLNAVNAGVSGDTTGDLLDRMEQSVYAYDPEILVLLGGVNDILSGYSDDTVVDNLRAIIAGVRQRLPDTQIILQSIYPVSEGWELYYTGHIRAVNARLERLAEEYGCRYVDLFSVLSAEDGRLDGRYSDDGLHPNDAGYRAVCPVITAALEEITGRGLLG